MFQKLDEVEKRFDALELRLQQPDVASNPSEYQKLTKEHSSLSELVRTYREYRDLKKQYDENQEMIQGSDAEMREMATAENKEIGARLPPMEQKLKVLLLPKDPNDDKNIMLEIRPAAGGDEAGIFAGDLYKMYVKYAEKKNWQIELMEISSNDVGGYKEIILMMRGEKVYSHLKRESGVHRVQRVPKTETQGRIHTSTVTVAVLPEAEDVEIDINPNDLRIDVFRSSGPGGQSVNTTDSAVRVTHNPSGLVVICRDEKSQHKNKAKALKVLKTRLLDLAQQKQHDKISADRLNQVGSGDRSEKIRTYNYPQGRITDHRIGVTIYQLESFMSGNIDEMINALNAFYEAELLKSQT